MTDGADYFPFAENTSRTSSVRSQKPVYGQPPSSLTIQQLANPVNTSAFLGTNPTDDSITPGLPVNRPQPHADWVFNSTSSGEKRGVTGNVGTTLHFELITFFKANLYGQADTAKHDLEARIRTQAIKQQVRWETQGKVQRLLRVSLLQ